MAFNCPLCGSSNIGHHVDWGVLWCHGRDKDGKECEWKGEIMTKVYAVLLEDVESYNRIKEAARVYAGGESKSE